MPVWKKRSETSSTGNEFGAEITRERSSVRYAFAENLIDDGETDASLRNKLFSIWQKELLKAGTPPIFTMEFSFGDKLIIIARHAVSRPDETYTAFAYRDRPADRSSSRPGEFSKFDEFLNPEFVEGFGHEFKMEVVNQGDLPQH